MSGKITSCIYNACVECNETRCARCGWNPDYKQKRIADYYRRKYRREHWIIGRGNYESLKKMSLNVPRHI